MILFDVNVLIHATRKQAVDHKRYRAWIEQLVDGDAAFAISELVLSSYLRIITNPKVVAKPVALNDAVGFVERIRSRGQLRHRMSRPTTLGDLHRLVPARRGEEI